MVTILLEQIIEILKNWLSSFTSWATGVLNNLNLIEEQTEYIDDIYTELEDIKSDTDNIAASNQVIVGQTQAINNKTTTINNNVTAISNNVGTISTNVGITAAFSEDIATNTMNTLDKVTTIASDTTQMRANTNNIYTDVDEIKTLLRYFSAGLIMEEDSEGAIASFDTDLTDYLVNCKCGFSTTKANNALSGVSSISVTRAGKNIFDKSKMVISTQRFGKYGVDDYNDTLPNGKFRLNANQAYTFTFSGANSTNFESFGVYNEAGTRVAIVYNNNKATFTPASTGAYFLSFVVSSGNWGGTWDNYDIQLEVGNQATEFEAFNGITQTVNLGSTYYGGELDALNGRLKVTHGYIASYNGETINEPWISSLDDYAPNTSPTTGAEVVYPLTTPYYVAVNDIAIKTLKGINNVYNDCDNTSVTYKESVKHYLDKQEG